MAKKKRIPSKGFLVRLPESCRKTLEQLYAKNRRPMTTEVQVALEKHAEAELSRKPTIHGLQRMNCPINERTGDGIIVGRCWFYLPDGKTCPRHGDVSNAVKEFEKSGQLTQESVATDCHTASASSTWPARSPDPV